MDLKIYPQELKGLVEAPPSKSLTHRAIICASFAKGRSRIYNPLICEDTTATINALRAIGVKIIFYEHYIAVEGLVHFIIPKKPIECRESASTLRMLLPIFSLFHNQWSFSGSEYLMSRIMDDDLLELKGIHFQRNRNSIDIKNALSETKYILNGDHTSQFISGMIFALPFLPQNTMLTLTGIDVTHPYIQLTIDTCQKFGISFLFPDKQSIILEKSASYVANDINIEGDFSNTACWLAAAYLNPNLRVGCLNKDTLQGDARFIHYLEQLSVRFKIVNGDYQYLKGEIGSGEIDISETPDLGPILAAIASLGTGTVIITGIDKLNHKESNRAESIKEGINRLGGDITISENRMIIKGKPILEGNCTVDSFNDHRIVMALAVIANRVKNPYIILNAMSVSKSYPNFFDAYTKLTGKVEFVS